MNALLTQFKALLSLEFETLTQARFDEMDILLDRKQALIAQLETSSEDFPLEQMTELRDLTARNDALYSAALDGFSVIKHRLDILTEASAGLTVYGDDGRRQNMATVPSSRETRA